MAFRETTIEINEGLKDLPRCREMIKSTVAEMGFSKPDRWGIVSSVFEACVNAVTHGWKGAGKGHATLSVRMFNDRLEAVVKDSGDGCGIMPTGVMPTAASNRGRGIPLMMSFMDEVKIDSGNGCKVTLVKYLPEKKRQAQEAPA